MLMASAFWYSSSFCWRSKARTRYTPGASCWKWKNPSEEAETGCEAARRVGQRYAVNVRGRGHRTGAGTRLALRSWKTQQACLRRFRRSQRHRRAGRCQWKDSHRRARPQGAGAEDLRCPRPLRPRIRCRDLPSASSGPGWTLSSTRSLSLGLRGGRR